MKKSAEFEGDHERQRFSLFPRFKEKKTEGRLETNSKGDGREGQTDRDRRTDGRTDRNSDIARAADDGKNIFYSFDRNQERSKLPVLSLSCIPSFALFVCRLFVCLFVCLFAWMDGWIDGWMVHTELKVSIILGWMGSQGDNGNKATDDWWKIVY